MRLITPIRSWSREHTVLLPVILHLPLYSKYQKQILEVAINKTGASTRQALLNVEKSFKNFVTFMKELPVNVVWHLKLKIPPVKWRW
jgi:flagellar motor switch protein FliM